MQFRVTLLIEILFITLQLNKYIIMMNSNSNGLLMQVLTGEGKSLIVAILAVIKWLQGHIDKIEMMQIWS